jgi:hypothetical protein
MAFATIGTRGIQAQSVDLSSKVTGTLPVPNGGLGIASGTTGQFLKFSGTETLASAAAGISEADVWRVTSGFTNSANPIASNWERADTYGAGQLGTGMSQSSGIFTFPSTGIYRISFNVYFYYGGDSRLMEAKILTTLDNSSYNVLSEAVSFITQSQGGVTYANGSSEGIFDVTNTSTHKCSFRVFVNNSSVAIAGDTNVSATYVTFIRLGDT